MNLARWWSPCWFGHAEPIKSLVGKAMHFTCPTCCADLGEVLAGQKFKARKPAKVKKRKSAEVLTLAGRKRA